MFNSLKAQLQKTRSLLTNGLVSIFKKSISTDLTKDLETLLLQADVGMDTCNKIIAEVTSQLNRQGRKELNNQDSVYKALEIVLLEILAPCEKPLIIPENTKPFVILLIGVNGAGKTTFIAKLANLYKNSNKKVVLACGDTFRAAAIEQLSAWGEKIGTPVIKNTINSDSAAVIFEAYNFATNNHYDVLIADTAGRLHTKQNLMDELKKISRVLKKINPTAPHEIMLVLDASIGQNSLSQFKAFHEAMNVTGITITKLDGTAKAGIIFSIANITKIPIRYISIGENMNDFKEFNAKQFVSALIE
jgi:fused signal recognition particle receptor